MHPQDNVTAASSSRHERKRKDAARRWIVRLTSGDMTEYEMHRFRKWVAEPKHERVFRHEILVWRQLGHLKDEWAGKVDLSVAPALGRKHVWRWYWNGMAVTGAFAILLTAVSVVVHHRNNLAQAAIGRQVLAHPRHLLIHSGASHGVRHQKDGMESPPHHIWFGLAVPFPLAI